MLNKEDTHLLTHKHIYVLTQICVQTRMHAHIHTMCARSIRYMFTVTACARVFYKAGARLILCSRNIEQLKALQSHLKEDEDGALFQPHIVKMDLSQPESVEKGVKDALDCYDKVDVLINNAGVSSRSLALDTTMEVERYVMEVNFFGPVALTKGEPIRVPCL